MLSRIWHLFEAAWEDASLPGRAVFMFTGIFGYRVVESLSGWSLGGASLLIEFLLALAVSFPVALTILLAFNAIEKRVRR